MQVSRTLRCLKGHQARRPLHLFRNFDEVIKGTTSGQGHRIHQRFRTSDLGCFKSQYSTTQENGTQKLQSDLSAPGTVASKDASTKDVRKNRLSESSTDAAQDRFDISEIPKPSGLRLDYKKKTFDLLLTKWQAKTMGAKKEDRSMAEVWKEIKPQLYSVVDATMIDSATPEMRLKCLWILLHYMDGGPIIDNIIKKLMKDTQFLPIKDIVDVIDLLSVSASTGRETRKEIVFATVNTRWFEIGPKHILFFLYQLDDLFNMKEICLKNRQLGNNKDSSPTTTTPGSDGDIVGSANDSAPAISSEGPGDLTMPINHVNVERRLINLVDELKCKDLARAVTLMGKWRNRNQILLSALVHRLSLAEMNYFSGIQLANLLYACSTLSIHNAPLLDKLASELVQRELSSPALVSSILSSLSYLRWYDSNLVSECLSYLAVNSDGLSSRDSWNIVMSLANLYALPRSGEEAAVVTSLAQRSFHESKSPVEMVNSAWSMAILKLLDGRMAQTLLESSFIEQFRGDADFQNRNMLQKLRNVSLAARFELHGYDGPFMEESMLNTNSGQEKSAAHKVLSDSLHNALSKFLDMNSYTRVCQTLPGGLYADAVMCSSRDGSPKPLTCLEEADSGVHCLAIQVIPFNGVLTSHPTMPCGIHQMTSRHLQHLGYVSLQIPYTDLQKCQSVLEHVNSIQSLLKKAVNAT